MGKKLLISVALFLLLGGILTATWRICGWPPPRLILKYGLSPAGGPTGRRLTVSGIHFVEVAPGYCQDRRWADFDPPRCGYGCFESMWIRLSGGSRPPLFQRNEWVENDHSFWVTMQPIPETELINAWLQVSTKQVPFVERLKPSAKAEAVASPSFSLAVREWYHEAQEGLRLPRYLGCRLPTDSEITLAALAGVLRHPGWCYTPAWTDAVGEELSAIRIDLENGDLSHLPRSGFQLRQVLPSSPWDYPCFLVLPGSCATPHRR